MKNLILLIVNCPWERGITTRPFPTMSNCEHINLAKETRTIFCNCYRCLTDRTEGYSKIITDRGHVRTSDTKIDQNKRNKREWNISTSICIHCFREIGKDQQHNCCVE